MKPQPIIDAEQMLPELDPAFQRGAFILTPVSPYLTADFHRLVSLLTDGTEVACYAPIMDILARPSLPYEAAAGRCFTMWLCGWPRRDVTLAAAIHEGAHYLIDRHPSRDEPDETKATRDWWASMGHQRDDHGPEWLAAVVQLWSRACDLGAEIPLSTFGLDQYATRDELAAVLRGDVQPRRSQTARRRPRGWSKIIGGRYVRTANGTTTIDGAEVSEQQFRRFVYGSNKTREAIAPLVQ